MKIKSIEIHNYRSLHDIKLTDLGNFVIFIGKNGSGKSNLLEGLELFFTDLDLLTNAGKNFDPTTWYDKRPNKSIDFIIELELKNGEMKQIFTADICKRLSVLEEFLGNTFKIHRRIEVNQWKNMESQLGKTFVAQDGKLNQLPQIETSAEVINSGVKDAQKQSQQKTIPVQQDIATLIFNNINNLLKNKFKLIRSPRESPERAQSTMRSTIIDPESKSYLNRLAVSPANREEEDVWTEFEQEFEEFSNGDLRVRGSIMEFGNNGLYLPVELSGSGDQALMILLRQFLDQRPFYGIEEPETRLHVEYQRKLFRFLKEASKNKQVLVATHSPVFVDKAFLDQTYYFSLDEHHRTNIKKVEIGDLKTILLDLGIMPSDFFFANRILFVEGESDKLVVAEVAEKMGIDLTNVSVIPLHGKDNGCYHLQVWVDASKNTNLPIFLLLDKVAGKEILELEKKKLIEKDSYHMLCKAGMENAEKCDIEDYYPKEILSQVISELAKNNAKKSKNEKQAEEVIEFQENEPVVEKINGIVKSQKWKLYVAQQVMEKISNEQIEEDMGEIVRFLKKVAR